MYWGAQDWLFKDEMNAAVKLGGGCAALARMQAPCGNPKGEAVKLSGWPEETNRQSFHGFLAAWG